MTPKEIILQQMAACHNEASWFVTARTALKDLTAEQALWHGIGANNTIWGIVNHLIFWNERHLQRFKGIIPPKFEGGNPQTFETGNSGTSEADWRETIARLDAVMSEWYQQVKNADETKLQGPAFGGDDSWYSVLAHSTMHDAHHIGQIVVIRKEQGSWNPETGVK